MDNDIWENPNFTFPYPIAAHDKQKVCYNHLTVLEMLEKIGLDVHAAVYLHLSTGLAGVFLPICVLLGTLTNLGLIIHVVAQIRLFKRLEFWAVYLSFIDIFFMLIAGLVEIFVDFGVPWWNSHIRPVNQRSQPKCKILKFFVDFLFTLRQNSILMLCIDQLYYKHAISDKVLKRRIFTFMIATFALTVIQAAPIPLCHGIWISHGRAVCSPDPQWSYVYIQFVVLHKIFYIDGNFQLMCIFALAILIWRQLRSKQMLMNFLRSIQVSKNLIGLIINDTLNKLNQECVNLKIVLYLACLSILSRCDRFALRAFHFYLFYGQTSKNLGLYDAMDAQTFRRLLILCTMCLFDLFEIIIASFTYLCWYTQVPTMRNDFIRLWRTLLHCEFRQLTDTTDTETSREINSRLIYDCHTHCRHMSKQMQNLQKHLRLTYAVELSDIRFRKLSTAASLD